MPLHLLHHRAQHNNSEYLQLLLTRMLSSMSLSIVGIFLPIYLLELGKSLLFVIVYFLIFYIVKYIHHYFFVPLTIHKIGLKHAMSTSFLLYSLSYLLLSKLLANDVAIVVSVIVLPFAEAIRWDTQHLDMLLFTSRKNEGVQVGVAHAIDMMGQVAGPLLAGFLTYIYGAEFTLLLGAVLLVLSSLPLFITKEVPNIKIEPKHLSAEKKKAPINARVANFASNFEGNISFLIWPIFIYFLFENNFAAVGAFFSAGFFVSALITIFLSRLGDQDQRNRDRLALIAAWWRSLTHIVRLFAVNPLIAITANTSGEIASSVKSASFGVRFYDYGKEAAGKLQYVRSMELSADIGKAAGWLLFLLAYLAFDGISFRILFIVAAFVSLLVIRIMRKYN